MTKPKESSMLTFGGLPPTAESGNLYLRIWDAENKKYTDGLTIPVANRLEYKLKLGNIISSLKDFTKMLEEQYDQTT